MEPQTEKESCFPLAGEDKPEESLGEGKEVEEAVAGSVAAAPACVISSGVEGRGEEEEDEEGGRPCRPLFPSFVLNDSRSLHLTVSL